MITLLKREVTSGDIPDMTRDELESEWRAAKECFDLALAQKIETDRIYVAAAITLNTLDRVMKKVEHRAAVAKREVSRSLLRTAPTLAQVSKN